MNLPPRLHSVAKLLEIGQFHSGLNELRTSYSDRRVVDRILKAEFLLHLGRWAEAETITRGTLELKNLALDVRARALEHLGYVTRHRGYVPEAISLWEESLTTAEKADDLEQICRSQLHLLAAKVDSYGAGTLGTLPADLRRNVTRRGDPYLWAWLHWRFAEVEARKGMLAQAERHIELGSGIVKKHPCAWLEARLDLLRGVISVSTSNLDQATGHFRRALEIAKPAGVAFVEAAASANLSDVCTTMARFTEARTHLEAALSFTHPWPALRLSVQQTLARLELLEGNTDACSRLLGDRTPSRTGAPYAELEGSLVRIALLRRRRDLAGAEQIARAAVDDAKARGAGLLLARFQLALASILLDREQTSEAAALLDSIDANFASGSLELLAEIECAKGRLASRARDRFSARDHFERAIRILEFLQHFASKEALQRQVALETERFFDGNSLSQASFPHTEAAATQSGRSLLAATKLFRFAGHPVLLGQEASWLLANAGIGMSVVTLPTHGKDAADNARLDSDDRRTHTAVAATRLRLGLADGLAYIAVIETPREHQSRAIVAALSNLISEAVELHELRLEQATQTPLWSMDSGLQHNDSSDTKTKLEKFHKDAPRVARSELAVLITGETGVGKEVLARAIHLGSRRATRRFEAINCASIPRELFEGHLFGHQRGAFTGAVSDSIGVIRGNSGGTIFLDEIGELSLEMQVKLLRLLDAKTVHPLGAAHAVPVDIRIIAATNANLLQLIEEKRFREDLFYRLNSVRFEVVPLRRRADEIIPLAQEFLADFCARNERPVLRILDETLEYLVLYHWPGNVRELRNEMERLAGVADGPSIKPSDLKPEILAAQPASVAAATVAGANEYVVRLDQKLEVVVEELSRVMVVEAIRRHHGNVSKASKELGITRKGLYNKRLRFGLL